MNIWLSAFLFAVGIVLVIKGGDWFVDAASWIAKALRVPTFIIGATIVSVATTLPEMIVSVIAAGEGKFDMSIGNAVGSVTANTGLILALGFAFMPMVIKRKEYWFQGLLMILSAALILVGANTGFLAGWASIALLVVFVLFMAYSLRAGYQQMADARDEIQIEKKAVIKNAAFFVVGAAAIVVGSRLLVDNGSAIAAFFGVPERIIAVTMVAIGTSLPELVTTITAIRKKESSLSMGNIIGANIIDLTLILPICSAMSGFSLPVSQQSWAIDIPACLIVICLALVPALIRQKSSRFHGILLLMAYAAYLVITL